MITEIGLNAYQVLLYFAIALLIVYHIGRSNAIHQYQFHVADTTPECVVLFMTDNWMICSPFDRTTKEVEPSITKIYFDTNPGISLSLEQVGPLHLRNEAIYPIPTSTQTPQPTMTPTLIPYP